MDKNTYYGNVIDILCYILRHLVNVGVLTLQIKRRVVQIDYKCINKVKYSRYNVIVM